MELCDFLFVLSITIGVRKMRGNDFAFLPGLLEVSLEYVAEVFSDCFTSAAG